MTDKNNLIQQTRLAFDLIQKLYLEASYLVKEIEGQLSEEIEHFVICKPSGYAITSRSSYGLESVNVDRWLLRSIAVSFVPEAQTRIQGGQTITEINKDLRTLYFRLVFDDKNIDQPIIYLGVLHDIKVKPRGAGRIRKFETIMAHLEYNEARVFNNPKAIDYEDLQVALKGHLIKNSLYDINDSDTLYNKVIVPTLRLFRG